MINNCVIQGRLGHDPELKEFEGTNGPYSRVSFSIANNRPFGDETDWIRCYMNGPRAAVIQKYFKKGSMIIVIGRLESYKSQDGTKTYYNIRMNDFAFADSKKKSDAPEGFTEVDENFDLF